MLKWRSKEKRNERERERLGADFLEEDEKASEGGGRRQRLWVWFGVCTSATSLNFSWPQFLQPEPQRLASVF